LKRNRSLRFPVAFYLDNAPAPTKQLKDQHYRRNNKQQMDQTTADTAEQSQQPQDQ
jgi:hypothetical protein